MDGTLYRRPLPTDTIAFSSQEGRRLFAEALAAHGLDGYFPLAEQFHTQADPAFCGLGSLVVALNALGIDPGRLWKGPWRWFAEDLLDCCVPLEEVRRRGVDVDELACLARCNGADVRLLRADAHGLEAFRAAVAEAARGESVLIASYDRSALGQTGAGHFSPLGGHHAARDLALVLDVARFKYPPHWVPVEHLWRAMHPVDPATGKARGWMVLRARSPGVALGFTVSCSGDRWQELGARLATIASLLKAVADVTSAVRIVAPLVSHIELRAPTAAAHRELLACSRAELQRLAAEHHVVDAVGASGSEATTLLLLALGVLPSPSHAALAAEVENVRMQLGALQAHAADGGEARA